MPRMPQITWTTPRVVALAGMSLLAGTAIFGIANAQTPAPTTPSGTPTPTRQQAADEVLSRFAGNLGVDVARVREAIKQTAVQYVDQALAAGRITQEQATAAKERINSGELGRLGFGPLGLGAHGFDGPKLERRGPGGPGVLRGAVGVAHEALAQFLGVSAEQLKTELDGKSLAQVAAAHGKSADQLKQFIVSEAETRLNAAVGAGRIDQAQATQMLDALKANVDAMINQVHQSRATRPGAGAGFFFEGPRLEGVGGGAFFFEVPRPEGVALPGGI